MLHDLTQFYNTQIASLHVMLIVLNALVHFIFASAVANDAGLLNKVRQKTALVSGVTWAFATLIGGVLVAIAYWFIHHSSLTRADYGYTEEKA